MGVEGTPGRGRHGRHGFDVSTRSARVAAELT